MVLVYPQPTLQVDEDRFASRPPTSMDDRTLIERFERQQLPPPDWTHRAHVRVAYLYLAEHPFEEALERVRSGIQALNAANGVPEGPNRGYNETTTRAFLHLVAATMEAYGTALPSADSEAFCDHHPQLMCKQILRCFYSPEQRMRPEAKTEFVAPDLAPLPRLRRFAPDSDAMTR